MQLQHALQQTIVTGSARLLTALVCTMLRLSALLESFAGHGDCKGWRHADTYACAGRTLGHEKAARLKM